MNAINPVYYSSLSAAGSSEAVNNAIPPFDLTTLKPVDMSNVSVPSMDPSRPQDNTGDKSIQRVDLSNPPAGETAVPYNASYNAVLLKQLSSAMISALKQQFPAVG